MEETRTEVVKSITIIILSVLLVLTTSFLLIEMEVAKDQAQVIEGYRKER